jgi:pimeloyl-ACP methyl ester carboxylesterase
MAAGTGPYGAPTFAAVQPEIATITRTCVYTLGGQPSEVLTGQIIARDWHTLLTATNVQGPYVIVAGSWAGFPARMFAYEYPDEVVGMVLIDALHEEDTVQERAILASYDDNQAVKDLLEELVEPIFDYASYPKSEEEVRAARLALGEQRLLGDKPLIVLTPEPKKDEEWSPGLPEELSVRLRDNWVALQKDAATLSSNSLFIVVEDTGHTIQQDRPEVIIDAIRKVVEAVRTGAPLE